MASAGWRVPAPTPDAMIRWPTSFGQRFFVSVDTEEEFDWAAPFSREARSVATVAALPAMHHRFAAQGIRPCYLCDYPAVTDPMAIEVLQAIVQTGGEIGAQLHPWVNPPHTEDPSEFFSFAGNLPAGLEAAKLDRLTAAIIAAIGRSPRAFRAGRYGIGPETLGLLAARGYRLDSSLRAGFDYSNEGGPDFGAIGNTAFRAGPGRTLVELPLTAVYTGSLRRFGTPLHRAASYVPRGPGLMARTRLMSRVPLTPEGVPIAEACEAVRVAVGEGERLLTFSFHSPSLVPGHTPYVRTDGDLAGFMRWWDVMLALLDRLAVRPASLDELLDAAGDAR